MTAAVLSRILPRVHGALVAIEHGDAEAAQSLLAGALAEVASARRGYPVRAVLVRDEAAALVEALDPDTVEVES